MEIGYGRDSGERLKALIRAPGQSHKDWPQVIQSLKQLKSSLESLTVDDPQLAWCAAGTNILVEMHSPVDSSELRLLPMRGDITRRPIFAALAAQPGDAVRPALVRTMQAFLLVAAAKREILVLGDEYHSPIKSAGLSTRKIAKHGLRDEMDRGICAAQSVGELCDLIESWLSPVADRSGGDFEEPEQEPIVLTDYEEKVMQGLLTLLWDAEHDRDPRHRQPSATGRTQEKRTTRIELSGSADDEGGKRALSAVIDTRLDVSEQKKRRNQSLPPVEEFGSRAALAEYGSTRNPRFPADQMTERQANRRIILKARGYKSSQQWTPNRTEILHPPALQALLALDKSRDPKSIVRWEMLALMLFTGCTVGDIQKFKVWADPGEMFEDPGGLGIIAETGMLIMPFHDLPQSWQPHKALERYFDRPDHRIEKHYRCPGRQILLRFPSYFEVGERLLQRARRQGSRRLFHRLREDDLERVTAALESYINDLNIRHHTALTLIRISRHLANSVYALGGDIAEALALSHQHKDSNDPRLYYYAPSVGHLARQYDRVWDPLARIMNGSSGLADDYGLLDDTHIGSAAVPLLPRIRSDVVTLANQVGGQMAIRGRRSRSSWWLVHNVFTAYVIRQVQWMTGIRAVRDPIELQNYDSRSGFLRINDKDSADNYGARVVWLIPAVQRQVQVYLQRTELAAKARSEDPANLAFRFIEWGGQIIDVSWAALEQFTTCEFPYAPNAHRHYQRTRLRELGIDAGYVDAWLGHGGIGREPYARHSAITPQDVRLALAPALETIWKELGWQVLPNNH